MVPDTFSVFDSEAVLSDFVFDAPLDELLFSTDPPEGSKDLNAN